jgi:hypothetical protein
MVILEILESSREDLHSSEKIENAPKDFTKEKTAVLETQDRNNFQ